MFFIPLRLPNLNHTSTNQVTTSLRIYSIAVSPSLLPAWGFGAAPAHPRDPKRDSLLAGAGKNNLPAAAALRGGRLPSLASLVSNGFFLTLWVIRILERYSNIRTQHATPRYLGRKVVLFTNFYSNTIHIFNYEKLSCALR